MEYLKSGDGGIIYSTVYKGYPNTGTYDETIMIANSKDDLRKMIRTKIQRILVKGHRVSWNVDTPHEVVMIKKSVLSGYDNSDSEFIVTSTDTVVGMGENATKITHNSKTRRNPKYEGNPECEMCYKQATKLYPNHVGNTVKTKKNVCAKCRKDLLIMKQVLLQK